MMMVAQKMSFLNKRMSEKTFNEVLSSLRNEFRLGGNLELKEKSSYELTN